MRISVRGSTYDLRASLRGAGLEWSPASRRWVGELSASGAARLVEELLGAGGELADEGSAGLLEQIRAGGSPGGVEVTVTGGA